MMLAFLAGASAQQTNGPTTPAQAPAAQTHPSGASLSLEDVVKEALDKNPAVQSAWHAYQAQRHRVPQAKSLPDPKVSVGWMGNAAPFSVQQGDPSSYRGVSAMQEVPFPGKLHLRGKIADQDAEAARWDYEAQRRRIAAEVKAAYYDLYFYDKALAITLKNKDLLGKLSRISEARYRVGKGIQQDVLRSQTELSLLLQKITVLEQQRDTAQARLNTLLSRNPDAPLPQLADFEPGSLNYSLASLSDLAHANDTGLQREQRMIERSQLATNLAHKEVYPDLGVAYMYEQRPAMPDMHGFTFTVDIPVFSRAKQHEAAKEAIENRASAQQARAARQNDLNFELREQYLAAKASEDLFHLYERAVVPQASLALESSMSAYQVGGADFATVLANFSNVLQYQVEYYREVASFETALARMEPLVGVDLTAAGAVTVASTPGAKTEGEIQ
jgi:cobalt-zinc-cadmium efflux system outer membrane protein